jgi:hypothetical protein
MLASAKPHRSAAIAIYPETRAMAFASVGTMRRCGDTRSVTEPIQREAGQTRTAIRTAHPHTRMPAPAQLAAMVFSADETCDVGFQAGSPSSTDYGPRDNEFSGEVNWVEINIGKDAENFDHLITPEQRLSVAMAIQ